MGSYSSPHSTSPGNGDSHERTPFLPQYAPEVHSNPSGFSGLRPIAGPGLGYYPSGRPAHRRRWAAKVFLGSLLALGALFALWSWYSPRHSDEKQDPPTRQPPVRTPFSERDILSSADWTPVEERYPHTLKPFARRASFQLDDLEEFFVHSHGARHTADVRIVGTEDAQEEGTLLESLAAATKHAGHGIIYIGVEARAKEPWLLENELRAVTLTSRTSEARNKGVGIFSRHQSFHDSSHTIQVTLDAQVVNEASSFDPHRSGKLDRLRRLDVQIDVGNVTVSALQGQLDSVRVHVHLGEIRLEKPFPETSDLHLACDTGDIRAPETIWTDKLVARSAVGSLMFHEIHATQLVHLQTDSGTVNVGTLYSPKAFLRSNVGSIDVDYAAVVNHLDAKSSTGKVSIQGLVPVVFQESQRDTNRPARPAFLHDKASVNENKEQRSHILVHSNIASVDVKFKDTYPQSDRDPPSHLSHVVSSTFTSQAGTVRVHYSPSFEGTVQAKSKTGSVKLAWDNPSDPSSVGRQWDWSRQSGSLGEEYSGCVFNSSSSSIAPPLLSPRKKFKGATLPSVCEHQALPSNSIVRTDLGTVYMVF